MRKTILSFSFLLLCLVCSAAGPMSVSGRVTCGKKGVGGVVVSDGYNTTITAKNGKYSLETEGKLGYVFISTPSGMKVPSDGALPVFYKLLSKESAQTADFTLLPDPGQEEHTMLCFGDFHLAGIHNDREQWMEWVKDVNDFIAERQGKKIYALTVGDMTWDIYWKSQNYNVFDFKQDINQVKDVQIFPAIGNHDHELYAKGELHSTHKYRQALGPTYYSFNIGGIHYVVLDAVDCRNDGEGKRAYKCRLNPSQLSWLQKDLSYVDKGTQVMVVSHIPLSFLSEKEQFLSLFTDFSRPVHFITAHLHSLKNSDHLKTQAGLKYYEHLIGCPAGSLWMTGFHSPGIAICKDGAPAGYTVLYNSRGGLSWQFKSTGHPLDYQFRAYDGNEIFLDPAKYIPSASEENLATFTSIASEWMQPSHDNYVYINIWNKDPEWKVEVTENGNPLAVEKISVHDPLHIVSYPAKVLNTTDKVGKITQITGKSNHFVKVKASAPDSSLEIKVTDRFGNVYSGTMQRPARFDIENYSTGK